MREGIHPKYEESTVLRVRYTFKTRSTKPVIKLEMCSNCHPFLHWKTETPWTPRGAWKDSRNVSPKPKGKTVVKAKAAKPKVAVEKIKGKVFSTTPRRKKIVDRKEK